MNIKKTKNKAKKNIYIDFSTSIARLVAIYHDFKFMKQFLYLFACKIDADSPNWRSNHKKLNLIIQKNKNK